MLEVQRMHSSHLLLPSPEVRSCYPKLDFSSCQIQSPPHHLGNRLCNPLTTSHWPPVASCGPWRLSPVLECLHFTVLAAHSLCGVVHWGSQSWTEVITLIVNSCNSAERQEKPRISKERRGWSQHSPIPSTPVGEAYPWPYDHLYSSKLKLDRAQAWVISCGHLYYQLQIKCWPQWRIHPSMHLWPTTFKEKSLDIAILWGHAQVREQSWLNVFSSIGVSKGWEHCILISIFLVACI